MKMVQLGEACWSHCQYSHYLLIESVVVLAALDSTIQPALGFLIR